MSSCQTTWRFPEESKANWGVTELPEFWEILAFDDHASAPARSSVAEDTVAVSGRVMFAICDSSVWNVSISSEFPFVKVVNVWFVELPLISEHNTFCCVSCPVVPEILSWTRSWLQVSSS